mgnify:CR=1 FL=1
MVFSKAEPSLLTFTLNAKFYLFVVIVHLTIINFIHMLSDQKSAL